MRAPRTFAGQHLYDRPKLRSQRHTAVRALAFLKPMRWQCMGFVAVSALSTTCTRIPPLLFAGIINAVVPTFGHTQDFHRVDEFGAIAVGVAVVQGLLALVIGWLMGTVAEGVTLDLRRQLYNHMHRQPLAFFYSSQTGALLSRLSDDGGSARSAVLTLASVVQDIFSIVIAAGIMFALSWQVTLLCLAVLPMFVFVSRRLSVKLRTLGSQRMTEWATASARFSERLNISGAVLVKLFVHPRDEDAAYLKTGTNVRNLGVRMTVFARAYYAFFGVAGTLAAVIVYWVGGHEVGSHLSVGALSALALYVTSLYNPLTDLATQQASIVTALVSFDRCFEVLDLEPSVREPAHALDPPEPVGTVRLDDVSFRYPEGVEVTVASLVGGDFSAQRGTTSTWGGVDRLSLAATPGTVTALVGPSGAGKTTVFNLICRFYDVDSGRIELDGVPVTSLSFQHLRRVLGLVPQDPHLFHDTALANLQIAKPDASLDEVVEACRKAQILEVIESLPQGFDTVVGGRGYRLSGGEKQRLAIARILLKDAKILLLDEATSQLDSANESAVQEALRVAFQGRTAMVIAHRLATVQSADNIVVMERGHIIAQGRHDELLRNCDLYSRLCAMQFIQGDLRPTGAPDASSGTNPAEPPLAAV